ncbi:MAG TPA: hypothetical protein VNU46_04380 [Gemmatimonadaceae bacterium]|jgi:hypothetical protein|nr:hypothetical protein [Gemmatimonadaceae bacterium]
MSGDREGEVRDRHAAADAIEGARAGSYTMEETVLTKCDVRAAFRRLPFVKRVIVALLERYAVPPGYTGPWPPTPAQVGEYLRTTCPEFGGRVVSARTVLTLHRTALRQLRTWLRRGGVHHVS